MPRARDLAWISVPLALYFLVLHRLWSNAPVWDDYDTILDAILRMTRAASAKEWIGVVVAQHNEHRIAVMRLAARAVYALLGRVDFRVILLLGNLTVVGILALAWAEYRRSLAAPLAAAAALLALQWSYYEAALMPSGALPNIGVVCFSFACLYYATRGGVAGAAACVLFAALATGSQGNGLFALPMAAAACAVERRRGRAWLMAIVALVLWLLYFRGYARPPNHPSLMVALHHPLDAVQLYLIVLGGVVPWPREAMAFGVVLLAALAWLTHKGAWREHPTAALWVAFVLLSAGAATVGRVGFGVFHASRYAVYSTCLVLIVFLGAANATRPWGRGKIAAAIACAAIFSFAISAITWPAVRGFAMEGRLLAKTLPASPDVVVPRYVGLAYPSVPVATRILAESEQRGIYSPREQPVYASPLAAISGIPGEAAIAGSLDDARASGSHVTAMGWTDLPATVPGRTISIASTAPAPSAMKLADTDRSDVATILGQPRLALSGLRLDLDYASDEEAARAAASLCVVVQEPGHRPRVLARPAAHCVPGSR